MSINKLQNNLSKFLIANSNYFKFQFYVDLLLLDEF
jgi:hypothetical protein